MKTANGRLSYSKTNFENWLNDMKPFLKSGCSLHSAIQKAGLIRHKDSIYRKYRLNDWFCEKITIFQSYPGELVNSIFAKRIEALHESVIKGEPLNKEDVRLLCFAVDKHRSCKPFFVSRLEVAKAKKINQKSVSEIIDKVELEAE